MKIKEIEEKKSKVKEVKKEVEELQESKENIIENTVEDETVDLADLIDGDFEDDETEEVETDRKRHILTRTETAQNIALEDVVASEPSTFSENESSREDFYKAGAKDDFYASGSDIYSTANGNGSNIYATAEDDNGRNLYGSGRPNEQQERAGEIRGEKRSALEIGGTQMGNKDRRTEDEKYKTKTY